MKITWRKNKRSKSFNINFSDEEFKEFSDNSFDIKHNTRTLTRKNDFAKCREIEKRLLRFDMNGKAVFEEIESALSEIDKEQYVFEATVKWFAEKIAKEILKNKPVYGDVVKKEVIDCAVNDKKACTKEIKTEVGLRSLIELKQFQYDIQDGEIEHFGEVLKPLHPNVDLERQEEELKLTEHE